MDPTAFVWRLSCVPLIHRASMHPPRFPIGRSKTAQNCCASHNLQLARFNPSYKSHGSHPHSPLSLSPFRRTGSALPLPSHRPRRRSLLLPPLPLSSLLPSRRRAASLESAMDLGGRPEPDLSLGLHAGALPRPPIADDSISLQNDPTLRDPPRSTTPLHLFDHQSESRRAPDDDSDATAPENGDEEEEEEISILGYTMSVKKRRRRGDSSSSSSCFSTHPSKRPAVEPPPSPPLPDLECRRVAVRSWGNLPLSLADPDVFEIMEQEKQRQVRGIELVASENFVCRAVLDALGSHLTNKYSEGLPGARYYRGNQFIDQIERLCCDRALAAFGLDPQCWGVNVQPYSCTSANFAVYTGLLLPKDRIMGLDSPSGGHVSHGYYTPSGKKISGASIFFESLSYKVNPQTGYIDYDKLEEKAMDFRPKILICGGSSYPRDWDYARFRQIADKCGAVLMCDMAQISGLVAARVCVFLI